MSNVSENTRVSVKQVLKDIESYHAFGTMTDYRANNAENSREAAEAAYETLRAAEQHAVTTQAAASSAADALTNARRDFHGVILGIKNEARALYGPSSDQVAALGLKKKSEQSKRGRVKKVVPG
jgi:hypothetical protein